MPTMIRPKLSFEANNATATPQKRSLPLGLEPPGTNRSISEKNGRLTPPATTASGLRVPQVAAKRREAYFGTRPTIERQIAA